MLAGRSRRAIFDRGSREPVGGEIGERMRVGKVEHRLTFCRCFDRTIRKFLPSVHPVNAGLRAAADAAKPSARCASLTRTVGANVPLPPSRAAFSTTASSARRRSANGTTVLSCEQSDPQAGGKYEVQYEEAALA
jgi:hypothetical protein